MIFLGFDGTMFDTHEFEAYVRSRKDLFSLRDLTGAEFVKACGEAAEAGTLSFEKGELAPFAFQDAVSYIRGAENSAMVITCGTPKLQRMKVESALAGIARLQVMYTGDAHKGDYIQPYVDMYGQRPKLIDDDPVELEILSKTCPTFELFEIRRDGGTGDGRWPVLRSMSDLH